MTAEQSFAILAHGVAMGSMQCNTRGHVDNVCKQTRENSWIKSQIFRNSVVIPRIFLIPYCSLKDSFGKEKLKK